MFLITFGHDKTIFYISKKMQPNFYLQYFEMFVRYDHEEKCKKIILVVPTFKN